MALQEGNDSAQPQAGDVSATLTPDTPAQAAPAPGIKFLDVDDLELQDAKAAVQTEEAADPGNPEATASPGTATAQAEGETQPQGQPAADGQGDKPGQPVVMIPKPRFDEAVSKAQQEAAYWRGQAEALKVTPQTGQAAQQQPTAPTFEQRLTDIHKAADALATKFDNGEITMAEYKRQERALTEYEAGLREEKLTAQLRPANTAQSGNDDLYLDSLTAQLEQTHPWVDVFEKVGTKADWELLKERATTDLIESGADPAQGKLWVAKLRERVATLCDELGPTLVAGRAQKQGIVLPTQQQQQQPGAAPLSPQARAMAGKLALQQQAPIDVSTMTGTSNANTGGIPTAAQLDSMSDDDIGKLPQAVRNKLLGVA